MNLASLYIETIRKGEWPIYYVGNAKKILVGDYFKISGTKAKPVSKVVLKNCKGRVKMELIPIQGTVKTNIDEDTCFSIRFKYCVGKKERVFFMRFHFFMHDPSVFVYRDELLDVSKPIDKCCYENCCDPNGGTVFYARSSGGSEYGGGGNRSR